MPHNLHMITQIAKNSNFNKEEISTCDIKEETDKPICKEVPKCVILIFYVIFNPSVASHYTGNFSPIFIKEFNC